MIRRIAFISFLLAVSTVFAQKSKIVSAEYTYYAPEMMSVEEAKRVAIDRAKIQALADEFGTIVSQNNSTVVSNQNGESSTQFFSLGGSEVKGEWIADSREPEITVTYIDNVLVVKAKVCGKAIEAKRAAYDLEIRTLRNGMDSDAFKNGDRFTVDVQSPINGYFSIWLADDNLKQVYCLLPYENANGQARPIQRGKKYTFLSTSDAEYPYTEETILTTEKPRDVNRLILIFSTKRFIMPITEQGEYLPELNSQKFEKWLQKNRSKDDEMYIVQKIIEISQ